jgi:two-component system NtrC family sensor kinase
MVSIKLDGLAKALFEEAGDALFLFEPESDQLLAINATAERLTKLTRAELLKMPATYWFRFGSKGGKDRLREAAGKTGVFHSQEGYFLRTAEDGVWVPVNLTVSRLHVQPQTLALITARDMREQREAVRAEIAERKQAEEKLKNLNAFLDSIVDNVPIMLFVKDAEHLRFQLFNKAGEELLGYERAEMIGKSDYDFFPREEADFFIKKDREVLEGKKLVDIPEEEIQTHSGLKYLHTIKIPILDDKGVPRYLLGISEDISAHKKLETERNRLRAFLAQNEKLASIGRLSAGVAHEINNPLAFVANNLTVLQRDCKGLMRVLDIYDAEHERLTSAAPQCVRRVEALAEEIDLPYIRANLDLLLKRTRDGLDRVTRIIHSLRGHARITPVERQAVSLPDLFDTSLEIIQTRLQGRKIEVERAYQDPPKVRCVFTDVNQVVRNLLINACQAIEGMPSSHLGRIGIVVRPLAADEVLIEVSDNGCGIHEDHLPQLFDPFFTTKDVREGSGLGLWVTHSIVSAHGGRIEVESRPGQGACFRVILPVG